MIATPSTRRASRLAAAIALVSLGWSAFATPGGTLEGDWLEPFVDDLMAEHFATYDLVGASLAVVAGGEVVLSKGYGFADLAAGVPVDADRTLFGTASVAKTFTFTAVMQLVERGLLDLDADVNAYLTAFQVPERFGTPVRVRDLLSHTAGFEDKPVAGLLARTGGHDLEAELIRHLPDRVWAPGEVMAYSNYGAALAGYLVAEVSGTSWADYLEAHVLEPLGMARTSGRQPLPEHLAGDLSKAYHLGPDGPYETAHEFVPLAPAGGMVATTGDMATFLLAHLGHGAVGDARILDEATARTMHTRLFTHDPRLPGNAHGFWEGDVHGVRTLDHGGDTSSYTLLVLVPEHDLGFYVAYNSPDGALAREDFRRAFLERVLPADMEAPAPSLAVAGRPLGAFTGTYAGNRISTSTLTKVIALGGALDITADADGLVTQIPGRAPQRWRADGPDSFVALDGTDRLVFRQDDRGRVQHVFLSTLPMMAFTPVAFRDRIDLHGGLLAFALLAVLIAWATWPVFGRRARRAGVELGTPTGRIVRRLPSIAMLAFAAYFVAFGAFMVDPLEVEFGVPPVLFVAMGLSLVAATLTAAAVVAAVVAWRTRAWSRVERGVYAFATLACVSLTWQLHHWNLLGFRA